MTDNLRFVREYLSTSTGTEGSLLIVKKIYETLVDEASKVLIPTSEAALYFGPAQIPGSSIDVNLMSENTMSVRLVPEGTEIPMDNAEYSTTNIKPEKYGVAIRITRELLEDAQWNLLQHNLTIAGRRMAEKVNALIISDALDSAANTVAGGASVTIANVTRAMQYLEDADKVATSYLVGNEVAYDLRNIDTFVEADKSGSTEMLSTGFIGTVYGMKVFRVSTNAGMTTTSSYVYDKNHAFMIAEKRGITVENFTLPSLDMEGSAVTMRVKVRALRTNATCKITSS
jgi:HK97 family phage major capsid protein